MQRNFRNQVADVTRRGFLAAGAAAGTALAVGSVSGQESPALASPPAQQRQAPGKLDISRTNAKIALSKDRARALFKDVAEWIHRLNIDAECMAAVGDSQIDGLSIFVRGECTRLLAVAARELDEPQYKKAVLGSAKLIAAQQLPEGVWHDGLYHGNIYLCDSTQGCNTLFSALPFASNSQKRVFRTALDSFANYLRYGSDTDPSRMGRGGSSGFLHPDGSVGLGYRHNGIGPDGIRKPHIDPTPFPVASGIVGARFSSMYSSLNQDPFFRDFSKKSLLWASRTATSKEGGVPYYLPPRVDRAFDKWDLALTAYCGEGWLWTMYQVVTSDEERESFKDMSRKWIDWILSVQDDGGLWERKNAEILDRCPLAPLFLMGYHNLFGDREDVVLAINKFLVNVDNPERHGAFFFMKQRLSTVFTGLMLAEYLWPGRAFGKV